VCIRRVSGVRPGYLRLVSSLVWSRRASGVVPACVRPASSVLRLGCLRPASGARPSFLPRTREDQAGCMGRFKAFLHHAASLHFRIPSSSSRAWSLSSSFCSCGGEKISVRTAALTPKRMIPDSSAKRTK